ncbi:hypothetical protein M430DRAFT_32417 [Amorphotheca resinae ATCC 22711]|uniref:Uncharacterized protein n=1 Tax=Amorphotheca resinae ATCC 22711 TaxID=857342 RepID=A0A2T3BEM5_AMORE|nr:hypothetical protein M430DRAFT_32417 [Amorphotheca resinae ATCC 22711]PSS27839.1 hypothetical protein M430DRAFT_32417 [Amorphotheca resinae ATCC 22711]
MASSSSSPSSASGTGSESSDAVDLAQAFAEVARGEKTAQALEAHLSTLEKKIDDLLASFDEAELQRMDESSNGKESSQERRGAE